MEEARRGGRPKGRPKTGGRVKGTPNKANALTKETINKILTHYTEKGTFKEDLDALSPKDRVDAMIKLVSYILPKPQAIAVDLQGEKRITIEDTLAMLAEENEE